MTDSPSYLAKPSSDCCRVSVQHTGTPIGREITIADVPTYISDGSASTTKEGKKKVLLYFADIFGPLYVNSKLLQDYYASQGWIVLGPDYFLGDPVYIHKEADFDFPGWLTKSRAQAGPLVEKWLEQVWKDYGTENVAYAAVSYCFGATYAFDLAAENPRVFAVATAHPTYLEEKHFQQLTRPVFLSCAENDHLFTYESRRRGEDILIEKKHQYTFQLFGRVEHGFGVKGNPEIGDQKWAKEESAEGIMKWFQRFSDSEYPV